MIRTVKTKCMNAIRQHPGILQSELCKMGVAHSNSIRKEVFSLCFQGNVIRTPDKRTYRLYPKGKEPQIPEKAHDFKQALFHRSNACFFREQAAPTLNKGHGDTFYNAFDELYQILYIDLKMISGACGMMK